SGRTVPGLSPGHLGRYRRAREASRRRHFDLRSQLAQLRALTSWKRVCAGDHGSTLARGHALFPRRHHRDARGRAAPERALPRADLRERGVDMTAAAILRAEALAKRFGGIVAASGINLAIRPNELRCIIGPNGAGKSTLVSLLCGIYRPDAGRVLLRGEDVTSVLAFGRVRMGLGLTFQTNRAYHNLSIRQNLEIATRGARAARASAAEKRFQYALSLFALDASAEIP